MRVSSPVTRKWKRSVQSCPTVYPFGTLLRCACFAHECVHVQALSTRLLKFNNEVVYEHLLTPQVCFALDYFEVMSSLCEVMCLIYSKFLDEVRRSHLLFTTLRSLASISILFCGSGGQYTC